MAEQVEGAPLLREYGLKRSIEGSNPSLSAIIVGERLPLAIAPSIDLIEFVWSR